VEDPSDSEESEVWGAWNEVFEAELEGISSMETGGPKSDD
jgi:hypothetical protein